MDSTWHLLCNLSWLYRHFHYSFTFLTFFLMHGKGGKGRLSPPLIRPSSRQLAIDRFTRRFLQFLPLFVPTSSTLARPTLDQTRFSRPQPYRKKRRKRPRRSPKVQTLVVICNADHGRSEKSILRITNDCQG